MAVDDLSTLKSQLPEVFADIQPLEGWDDDWFILPIDEPENGVSYQDALVDASKGSPNIESDVVDQPSFTSRVNYLVRKDSSLALRLNLGLGTYFQLAAEYQQWTIQL